MIVTVSRKAHFNAAHRLFRKEWTDEKNAQVFGKCSNPNFASRIKSVLSYKPASGFEAKPIEMDWTVIRNEAGTVAEDNYAVITSYSIHYTKLYEKIDR